MSKAYETYCQTIESVETISSVYKDCIKNNPDAGTKYDDLLRGEYVLLVSAYEFFFHSLLLEKEYHLDKIDNLIHSLKENRAVAALTLASLLSMGIDDLKKSHEIVNHYVGTLYLDNIAKHIDDKFKIPDIKEKLEEATTYTFEELKNILSEILSRRHRIVHATDIETITGERMDISLDDVIRVRNWLHFYVDTIENNIDLWIQDSKLINNNNTNNN